MEQIDRLNKAIQYIEENLQKSVDYKEISKITLSPISSFQRFFALTTGMALSEYIRRRRLSNAASDLLQTSDKIIDIAVKYSYESVDAFSVAFKREYNVSPSFARQNNIYFEPFHRMYYILSIKYLKGEVKMKKIANNRKLCDGNQGHNYELVDCIKFILECKGWGDKPDFWDIAALTGDAVAQVYNRNPATGTEYCVSGYMNGPAHIKYIFDALGYEHEYVVAAKLGTDLQVIIQKIVASIDNDIPVLVRTNMYDIPGWLSDVGTHCLITGYDQLGQVIKLWVGESEETIDFILTGNSKLDLIFVSEKQRDVTLEEIYLKAVDNTLQWLTLPERNGVFFGAAAYRAWADDIDAGRYDDNNLPLWSNYCVYVANLATSGEAPTYIFENLAALNPSYTHLVSLSEQFQTRLHSEMPGEDKKLWTILEKIDAGMDTDKVKATMRDKEKRAKVASALRNYAERLDHAVRLLKP